MKQNVYIADTNRKQTKLKEAKSQLNLKKQLKCWLKSTNYINASKVYLKAKVTKGTNKRLAKRSKRLSKI